MVCSGCSDFLEEHNRSAVTTEGGYYDTEKGFESLKMCIRDSLNSLHYGGMDGWIPIWIERNAPSRERCV